MSPFSNNNVSLLGAAAAKSLMKPGKPGGVKGAGLGAAAGPAVSNGLAHSTGIRSAQAGLIAQLQRVNQAINVLQALEGESSALNDMLGKIESMIKQGSKNLVSGEMNTAKMSMTELVKDMMKGFNAPIYADASNYDDKQRILAYIGKGFSIDIVEGGIVFDVNKMLEEVYKKEQEQERQDKQRLDYRKAMGLVKGALEQLLESLSDGINKAGGLGAFLKDVKEANNLSKNMLKQIREDSSMMSRSYGDIDAESAAKLLHS